MSKEQPKKESNLRKHTRFKTYSGIRALSGGKELQTEKALVNISEGGLLFYAHETLPIGLKLELKLDIEEFNSSITVGAEVTWSQRSMEREDNYFVGVNFIKIEDYDLELIRKLQDRNQSKQ